jgi:hypothetical protein
MWGSVLSLRLCGLLSREYLVLGILDRHVDKGWTLSKGLVADSVSLSADRKAARAPFVRTVRPVSLSRRPGVDLRCASQFQRVSSYALCI